MRIIFYQAFLNIEYSSSAWPENKKSHSIIRMTFVGDDGFEPPTLWV